MATQGLQYDPNQALKDATLTQDQLAARSQVPGAITLDQMKPVAPITLPQPTFNSGQADALVSGVNAGQKTLQDYAKEQRAAYNTPESIAYQNALNDYALLQGQDTGKNQYSAQAKIDSGAVDLSKQQAELNGQMAIANASYAQLSLEAQAKKDALEAAAGKSGITTDILVGQQGAAERSYNSQKALKAAEIAMIAAKQQAVAGNLNVALQIAQNAVDAKYGPIEDQIKVKQAQLTALKEAADRGDIILSKAEEKQTKDLDRKYAEDQKKLEDEKAQQKAISEMIVNALPQGAPQDLVDKASQAKTSVEAAKILGKYSGDYLKYEMLKEQIKTEKLQQAKIGIDIKKVQNEITQNNPTVSTEQAAKYAGALQVILGSDKFTKDQKIAITNAVNTGQDPFSVIKNQAKNIMGQTNATKLDNYETAKAQIENIQKDLKDFYANGGKTGLFTGNYEKTLNNLGQVNDPKLVNLATQISAALQIYRNAVSGTAYSVQEGKDIASIFPGINKSEGLNQAVLSGRLSAFDTTIDATYRNTLGSSYDELKKLQGISTTSQSNPFSQALGGTNGTVFNGTSIISGVNNNGTFNFNIPK